MPTIRIDDLTLDQLDWVLARRLLPDGFVWESGKLYCLAPSGLRRPVAWSPTRVRLQAQALVIEHRVGVVPSSLGWIASWSPRADLDHWDWPYNTESVCWVEAAMRCLAKSVVGLTADIPPALLRVSAV